MVLPLIVIAMGGSMALPPAATAVLRSVSARAIGKAAGANGMFRELGGVFGLSIAFSDGFAAAMAVPVPREDRHSSNVVRSSLRAQCTDTKGRAT
jgi:hypothetical protein